MAGTSLKFWKVFSNVSNTKNVLTNKCLQPVQSFASVKQPTDKFANFPEKPKRPASAFLTYYNSIYHKLSERNPGFKIQEIAKLAGAEWKICDPNVKSELQENFKKRLADYKAAKENYEAKLSPAMKEELSAENERVKKEALKKKQKKDKKELGKPKKPPTPWTLYVKSKSADRGSLKFPDWVRQLSKEWYLIDSKIKAKQEEEYQAAMIKYKINVDKWEEEMIRQGRSDLVRSHAQIKSKAKAVKAAKPSKSKKSKKSTKSEESTKSEKSAEK